MTESSQASLYQTTGLFLLTNALVILHGVVRIQFYSGSTSWGSNNGAQIPPALLLTASCLEVSFGVYGLVLSLAAIFGDFTLVKKYIKSCVVYSIICGWVAFISFAFVNEIFNIVTYPTDETFGRVMGLLGILGYCAALIGSQAFFAIRLMHSLQGKEANYDHTYIQKRQKYYLFLLFLVGFACLAAGAYAATISGTVGNVFDSAIDGNGGTPEGGSPEGGTPEGGTPEGGSPEGGSPEGGTPEGGSPEGGYVHIDGADLGDYPPFICTIPILNILVGLFMMLIALWGFIRTGRVSPSNNKTANGRMDSFAVVSLVVWLLHFAYLGLVAPSYTSRTIAAVQISILSIPVHFMPIYLDAKLRGFMDSNGPETNVKENVDYA